MKSQDIKKYHELSLPELVKKINQLAQDRDQARLELAVYKLKDVKKVQRLSHEMAVLKTIRREKELAAKSEK